MRSWPEGYNRRVYDTVASTLSEAARLIPDLAGPTWIMALQQTAARGRRGRSWSTPHGNFASTLVMRRKEDPGTAALRSFVASLALFRALEAVTGRPDSFALKWPNDVLLKGGKVAGILLETTGEHLVIGIGVNLLHAPEPEVLEKGALPAVSLARDLGQRVPAEDLLDALATAYAELDAQFTFQGFAPIRRGWLARAARLGEVITARTMRDAITGTFEDVDETGNLILKTAKGIHQITAADVYF
ncbi:MAG: biotin--[acetyl-CoA-carboxylase] ligase [Pseudomonadota bacterium]